MEYVEFSDCLKWWDQRNENGLAWRVKAKDVLKYDDAGKLVSVNLDIKNPGSLEAMEHQSPEKLLNEMLVKERRVMEIIGSIQKTLLSSP